MLPLKKLGGANKMHKFIAEVVLLVIIVSSCQHEKNRVRQSHLHNYPPLGDCPSLEEQAIDNELFLYADSAEWLPKPIESASVKENNSQKLDICICN